MKRLPLWFWIIPLGLIWPLIYILYFLYQYIFNHRGNFGPELLQVLVFISPMSLAAGIVFLSLWKGAKTRARKEGIILGYIFASPVAFIGSMFSGLVIPRSWLVLGILLYGGVPLVIGMLLGYFLTAVLSKTKP